MKSSKSSSFSLTLVTLLLIDYSDFGSVVEAQNRVAPGVPPQNYQHQQQHQFNPGQQHHQQQMQFQQPQHHQQQFQGQPPPPHQQQNFQQPPPPQIQHQQQQFQQPIQQQGVPLQQGGHSPPPPSGAVGAHGHSHSHVPHGGQPILDASNLNKERQHIQEHMEVPIDTSQMSEQELQFHYFKMHDADNNNKLDGCELVKSLIHWHDQSNHDPQAGVPIPEAKVFKDDELINMIDPILQNDDKNGDGFIDYAEFSLAQASAAARAKHPQQ